MFPHRIRAQVVNEFTRTAKSHIERGDLSRYEVKGDFIYKYITDEEYAQAIKDREYIMHEIGVHADYDFSYKPDEK